MKSRLPEQNLIIPDEFTWERISRSNMNLIKAFDSF